MKTLSNFGKAFLTCRSCWRLQDNSCLHGHGKTEEPEELEDLLNLGYRGGNKKRLTSPESVEAPLFRVTPFNARFNPRWKRKVLFVRESSHVDVGVATSPKHYRLKRLSPLRWKWRVTEGPYTAYSDLGRLKRTAIKSRCDHGKRDIYWGRGGLSELIEIAATGSSPKGSFQPYSDHLEDPEAPEGRKEINSAWWVENCEIRIVKGDGARILTCRKHVTWTG